MQTRVSTDAVNMYPQASRRQSVSYGIRRTPWNRSSALRRHNDGDRWQLGSSFALQSPALLGCPGICPLQGATAIFLWPGPKFTKGLTSRYASYREVTAAAHSLDTVTYLIAEHFLVGPALLPRDSSPSQSSPPSGKRFYSESQPGGASTPPAGFQRLISLEPFAN